MPLETPAQAARLNRRQVNAYVCARAQARAVRLVQLHVAIVDADATGTELAAEFRRTGPHVKLYLSSSNRG